jgi:hypothetical protein
MTQQPEPYKRRRGAGGPTAMENHVLGWGWNFKGQLGTGWWFAPTGNARYPVPVESTIRNIDAIAAGNFMAAAQVGGRVAAWGQSQYGQLAGGKGPPGLWNGTWEERLTYIEKAIVRIANKIYVSKKPENHAHNPETSPEWWETSEEAGIESPTIRLRKLHPEAYVIVDKNFVAPNYILQLSTVKALGIWGIMGIALLQNGEIRQWGGNFYGVLGTGWDQDFGPKPRPLVINPALIKEAHADAVAGSSETTNFTPIVQNNTKTPKIKDTVSDELGTFEPETRVLTVTETSLNVWTLGLSKPVLKSITKGLVTFSRTIEEQFWPERLQYPNWPVTPFGTVGKKFEAFAVGSNTREPLVIAIEEGTKQVWGWGANTKAQLPPIPWKVVYSKDTFRAIPVRLYMDLAGTTLMQGVTAVTTNGQACMALKEGKILGWGSNNKQILLQEAKVKAVEVPTFLPGLSNVVAIALGRNSAYAVIDGAEKGELYSWGLNQYGQLGIGTFGSATTPVTTPTRVGTLKEVDYVVASVNNVAVRINGKMYIWGQNRWGNVGDGSLVDKSSPFLLGIPNVKGFSLTEFSSWAVVDAPYNENPCKPSLNINKGNATLTIVWKYAEKTGKWFLKYQRTVGWEVEIREEEEEAEWLEEYELFEESGGTEGISLAELELKRKEQQEASESALVQVEIFPTEISPGMYTYTWTAPEAIQENLSYLVHLQTKEANNTFGIYKMRTESMWANS